MAGNSLEEGFCADAFYSNSAFPTGIFHDLARNLGWKWEK
jgi:hypothetical protein